MHLLKLGLRVLSILLSCAVLAWAWRSAPPALTRGPYQQSTTATSITLVCQTGSAAEVILRYGARSGPPWEVEQRSPLGTTHVFALSGLLPETRYAYELSSGGSVLAGGPDHFFRTAPPANSRAPFRFLAWGDSGTGSQEQLDVAAWMEEIMPEPEFALGLGDLVYDSGEWQNYDPRLFRPYAALFRRMTFWPTMGNHDYKTENGAPYLSAFYLPTASGAPGHPSNTELYYSFDHGLAHFTCLDSESSSSAPGGAMYRWLEDDLDGARARGKRWLIVFMHHPPYSRGTHDSTSESDLITLHDDLVPLFDAKHVDLVLTGHSHVYERSYLVENDAILQADPGAYTKVGSPDGTIYLVSGCGGKTGDGPLDHPLMARSYGDVAGFNVIDVSFDELRGSFVEDDGRTTDLFSVTKAADRVPPRVSAVQASSATRLDVTFGEPVQGGTGTAGAESLANYSIPGAAVLGATLGTDRRTVALSTSSLAANRAYELTVLRVADLAGNAADQRVPFVRAAPVGGLPTAVLDARIHTANVPARITFSGVRSSDAEGPLASLRWDFGDGSALASGTDVEHLYTRAGLFTVTLVVTDGAGLAASAATTVRLHDDGDAPRATPSASATVIAPGESVTFSSASSLDPDGGPLWSSWDFDDPASGLDDHASGPSAVHGFAAAGTYSVALTVVDDEGSGDGEVTVVTVGSSTGAPTAAFTSAPGADPRELHFADASTGQVTSWAWDFGDGATSTEQDPVHLYAAAGDYSVSLTATGPSGSDGDVQVVHVGAGGGPDDDDSPGGACSMAVGPDPRGDPSFALSLALVLLVLVPRRSAPRTSSFRAT